MKYLIAILALLIINRTSAMAASHQPWWNIQAIDTMKFSRDPALEILNNPTKFEPLIKRQIRQIAESGATHAAIGTPYDERFYPVLKRFVDEARVQGLNVWLRGNWAGWEGWFETAKIGRKEHLDLTERFLLAHGEILQDGDIFTPCPECENGGPGDPRRTGDVTGFREFMIDEYRLTQSYFDGKNLKVQSNLASMNGDVARLIMNPETTREMGGVVTIDHYVRNPEQLAKDVAAYARDSQGLVVLGEMGMPIPDIHGDADEAEQAQWMEQAMERLTQIPYLVGVNYWVGHGGSTALWEGDQARTASATLTKYYRPRVVVGQAVNSKGGPVEGADIKTPMRKVRTDEQGEFRLPILESEKSLTIGHPDYENAKIQLETQKNYTVVLAKKLPAWCYRFQLVRKFCDWAIIR